MNELNAFTLLRNKRRNLQRIEAETCETLQFKVISLNVDKRVYILCSGGCLVHGDLQRESQRSA